MNRDREFLVATGRLASLLNLSISATRQRIDYQIAQAGASDRASKFAVIDRLLLAATADSAANSQRLDAQLNALESEADFLDED
jgi:hypothetical protein